MVESTAILGFVGPYDFLSNFWDGHPVTYKHVTWKTAEHAFQAMKSLDPADWERINLLPTPGKAKRAGRKLPLRSDWEAIKIDVMTSIVRKKFKNKILRVWLLATGDRYLEETNTWGDTFYGVYNGRGENNLGKILMAERTRIRTKLNARSRARSSKDCH